MSTGPKSGWGGKRAGSGRKSIFGLTEKQIKDMLRTARKFAREHGKTLDEVLLGIIYDNQVLEFKDKVGLDIKVPAVDPKTRVMGIKVFKEFSMGKSSEQNVKIMDERYPVIGLPEMRPDPAKTVYPKEGNA